MVKSTETHNVLPWLLAIPGVVFVAREPEHHYEADPGMRRCRICRIPKPVTEFDGPNGRVCPDCRETNEAKRGQAISLAQKARWAKKRAERGIAE